MACQQTKRPVISSVEVEQTEAVGGRAVDSEKIGVVGLVAGIGRQAILLGGQRVNDPRFKLIGCECAFNWQVVNAGPLDGDDDVAQAVTLDRLAELGDGGGEAMAIVLEHRGRNENAAIEVGQHPFGPGLGTIDSHDAEVVRPDLLDPGDGAIRKVWRRQNGAAISVRST